MRGAYREDAERHSIALRRPQRVVLARSVNGGQSWSVEEPETLVDRLGSATPCPGGIDFSDPGFALRCNYGDFQVSSDRGRTWRGPYLLPHIGRELKARTDYVVRGSHECILFLAAFEPAGGQDRALCVRTADGGARFDFASWMTGEPASHRSAMPSTVSLPDGTLLSALRRRENLDGQRHLSRGPHQCWVDLHCSRDGGETWRFRSRVANTRGRNGNPAALARLGDGRLCVSYGYRDPPYGVRARLSSDEGSTWGNEIVLRDDGRSWDLGYPRVAQRSDGRLVTIYYRTTNARREQHIAATIWDPDAT